MTFCMSTEQWARTSHMMVYFIRWIHRAIHISPSNWDDQSLRATNFMQSPDNSFITTKIAADSSQNNRNEAPHRSSVHNTRETSNTMGNFIRNSCTLLKYHSIALLASAVHQNICCCVVFFFFHSIASSSCRHISIVRCGLAANANLKIEYIL